MDPEHPSKRRSRYVHEMDVVRILTFACVIAVHTIGHTAGQNDVGLIGVLMLTHFTRNVFFALTGFVLVYSYRNRPVPMRKFWPRRFLLVGVPYLVWSAIYVLLSWFQGPHGGVLELAPRYLQAVLTGTAYYHMYFLLVTMQVYALFPLLVWVIRVTRGRHTLLLLVSGTAQVVISAFNMYKPGSLHWIHLFSNVTSYQGFIVLGAVAAAHPDAVLRWVRVHRRLIVILTIPMAAVTVGVYLLEAELGLSYFAAANPVQPVIMVWSVVVGVALLSLGAWWADRRRPDGWAARAVAYASDRSFGIFLAHPLVIWFVLWAAGGWVTRALPNPWLALAVYVLVVGGSVVIADASRRTPLSLPLAGRPFRSARVRPRDDLAHAGAR